MRLGTQADLTVARASDGLLWTAQHCFYRAGSSERPSWLLSSGTPHLGHFPTGPTTAGPRGMVASLLSFRASTRIPTDDARAATRARGQVDGATRPPAYQSRWQREERTDDGRRARCSLAPCRRFPLESHSSQMRWQCYAVGRSVNVPAEEVRWAHSRMRWPVRTAP
jgi:hypothetical protein